jgi:hypothetical protein
MQLMLFDTDSLQGRDKVLVSLYMITCELSLHCGHPYSHGFTAVALQVLQSASHSLAAATATIPAPFTKVLNKEHRVW